MKFPIRIWIPYTLLSMGTSNVVVNLLKKKIGSEYAEMIQQLDHKTLKQLIHSLKEFKGTELVNVKDKDGTIVRITL
ncbi:hypothetical protein [Bacillus suaedaesalsae]|uniref:Uncharacterized protein n=1 Tax=Bacillus suaedaesalsae TaxID=2810349 RepID=A0ABS2DGA8_9BACI|nr:hypothetical protein [Bacillus suaedaesalsae]MBM6616573.1 hypothetical protein [Bacillus suaedaesalsae]